YPNEKANDMYSRLNVLVEEIKSLDVKNITEENVVRKIISILPRPDYHVIATLLHQEDLQNILVADVLGRIVAYEIYELEMPTTSTSTPSKNLALKAEHKHKKKLVKEESSGNEDGD